MKHTSLADQGINHSSKSVLLPDPLKLKYQEHFFPFSLSKEKKNLM